MPTNRIGFSSEFVLVNEQVGIGTTNPTARLDVRGQIRADNSTGGSGVSTVTTYNGFLHSQQNLTTTVSIAQTTRGNLNSLSGEIKITGDLTVTDDTRLTGGRLDSLTVTGSFDLPSSGSIGRELKPEKGSTRFNSDLGQLEFYTGTEWRTTASYDGSGRGRGVFGGGAPGPVGNASATIDFIQISTLGNAVDFGVLTGARNNIASCSSNIRGVWGGGSAASYVNTIDYVTIASQGNAISFGTLSTVNRAYLSACSSSTRGLFGGGYTTSPANATVNVIDYIQFSTLGNAVDFGDLFTGRYSASSFSSPTRAIWAGGAPSANTLNIIDYVTIASTGNAVKFGELTTKRWGQAGCSNSVRGISAGGGINTPTFTNIMDYVTIASLGNAIYFGDLTEVKNRPGGCATQIRGVFGGSSPTGNVIEYVTIASTGNAIDFGDLTVGRFSLAACSDSHGGLGGF